MGADSGLCFALSLTSFPAESIPETQVMKDTQKSCSHVEFLSRDTGRSYEGCTERCRAGAARARGRCFRSLYWLTALSSRDPFQAQTWRESIAVFLSVLLCLSLLVSFSHCISLYQAYRLHHSTLTDNFQLYRENSELLWNI